MHAEQNVHLVHVFGDQAWVFMANQASPYTPCGGMGSIGATMRMPGESKTFKQVHICTGIIAPMRANTRKHGCAYVCMCLRA